MVKKLILASKNPGKISEIQSVFAKDGIQVISLLDIHFAQEIIEDAQTFEGNALKKALAIHAFTNEAVLADDSGLCVDALNHEPGVFSARYGGERKDDQQNMQLLLHNLLAVQYENRGAEFVCAMAFITPSSQQFIKRGVLRGHIIDSPRGSNGFGYDPIFFLDAQQKTMAELTMAEKNQISHRSQAINKIKPFILENLG